MRLYVLPSACSLASHIALEAVAQVVPTDRLPFEIIVVDRCQNYSPEYLAINPLGTVPCLVTDEGWLRGCAAHVSGQAGGTFRKA